MPLSRSTTRPVASLPESRTMSRQGPAQLGTVVDQLPLQPGLGGHQVHQLHHTGGVAQPLPVPAGAGHRLGPERLAGGPLRRSDQRGGVAQPGDRELFPQTGSPFVLQRGQRAGGGSGPWPDPGCRTPSAATPARWRP